MKKKVNRKETKVTSQAAEVNARADPTFTWKSPYFSLVEKWKMVSNAGLESILPTSNLLVTSWRFKVKHTNTLIGTCIHACLAQAVVWHASQAVVIS